jgi:hypothetical protein
MHPDLSIPLRVYFDPEDLLLFLCQDDEEVTEGRQGKEDKMLKRLRTTVVKPHDEFSYAVLGSQTGVSMAPW